MAFFNQFIAEMGVLGYAIVGINLVLLFFAKSILSFLWQDEKNAINFKQKLMIFRALNVLMIGAYAYVKFYHPVASSDAELSLIYKLIASLAVLYIAYLATHLLHYLIIKKYGKQRVIKGEARLIPSYQTRLLNIFASLFIGIIAMISIIHVLKLNSLLEAGGIIGFIGVMLALTQGSWAPDIFSGLILLNSDMLQEGDVILIKEPEKVYGLVYKTKVFHTVILNLKDNHRMMIRNTKLRDLTIHNLSKFASAKGLRECLTFKIGYDVALGKVHDMFAVATKKILSTTDSQIETKHGIECLVNETGDHAVEWAVYYYTKNIDKLLSIRQMLIAQILKTANEQNISLATPLTYSMVNPANE